jgi:hypothetical protein
MSTILQLLYLPWPNEMNRNYLICVVSPKVAKASTVPGLSRVADGFVTNFANVNDPLNFARKCLTSKESKNEISDEKKRIFAPFFKRDFKVRSTEN